MPRPSRSKLSRPARPSPAPASGIPTGRGDLASSLVLIFPLLLAYELGVLVFGRVNGADLITHVLWAIVGNRPLYLLVHAVLAIAFLVWIRRANRWGTLSIDVVAPLVLEAAVYAFTLGTLITLLVDRLLGLGVTGSSIIAALGAGVHEELVFRLVLVSGIAMLCHRLGPRTSIAIAIASSSLLFAAAHHAAGEPFTVHAFVFRTLAGVAFALIFWFRSLAHAVYAHVLYDIVVALSC
jgi:membrane protease YdiL (CAAX protease family)